MMLNPPVPCCIPGCEKMAWARRMCQRHYDLNRRHGDPLFKTVQPTTGWTPEERFWHFVIKGPDCWGWSGHTTDGYGVLTVGRNKQGKAHRFSYELHNGPIPAGMHVLHRCDNPPCSNPAHLFLGTQADNVIDMDAKGRRQYRAKQGTAHAMAKLNEQQVREIRAMAGPARIAAARFGVSESTIYMIRGGHVWKHL